MTLKSKRNLLNKQKRSRNQQKNKRSRQLNLIGGENKQVFLLYVTHHNDPDAFEHEYELILATDNICDLLLMASDVSGNMSTESDYRDEVVDNMFLHVALLNNEITRKLVKIPYELITTATGRVSSNDESTLYYTCDSSSGLVLAIYENRDHLEADFPEADIKSIKKNDLDWHHPLFSSKTI
jgi:hypothetical protein